MGDEPVSRVCGADKRLTVTGPRVEISGADHVVTCTNPGLTCVRVYGADHVCIIISGNPRIIVHGADNVVRTINGTSARDIIVSGADHAVFSDRNAHDIEVSGADSKVRIQGNAHQIRVSGSDAKFSIFGNVDSITLSGQNHNIYVQGNCTGDIRIGETGTNSALTKRNKILVGGSAGNLRILASGYRNQITCTRIETIRVEGDENRVKTICEDIADIGTQNSIGPEVNCDAVYPTRDRDSSSWSWTNSNQHVNIDWNCNIL